MLICRTEYTAVSYGDIAQTYLIRSAAILVCPAVAYQTLAGVVGHEEFKGSATNVIDGFCLGVDYHPVTSRVGAGGLISAHLFNFNNAEATTPIWFQVRVMTQGRDIDISRLGGFKHCHPFLCLDLLVING